MFQTASKTKITTYFQRENREQTYSTSLAEQIEKTDENFYEIRMLYRNSGAKIGKKTLDSHEGANILKYLPGNKKNPSCLKGHYFTNRQNQTRGELNVQVEQKKVLGKF